MSEIAIKVDHLSKLYQIGTKKSGSLRDTLTDKWQQVSGKKTQASTDFWALQDVSFDIHQGEAVGIVGKNGAGKSTLLKVLSRITEPTKGRVEINGRVASLLEVGTGFHPDLSGRENIFLNGTILGMTRKEIKTKFDEIVAFSGVEKFIDTPVKFYSSGMYVRLAFAVAAHLEPEILIIDEVLAVGDAEFQKKCLGKMGEVAGQGRTVLFVSHNMQAVKALCSKAVFLKNGQMVSSGNAKDIIDTYIATTNPYFNQRYIVNDEDKVYKKNYFQEICIVDSQDREKYEFKFDEPFKVHAKICIQKFDPDAKICFALLDRNGSRIFSDINYLKNYGSTEHELLDVFMTMPNQLIAPNSYSFHASIFSDNDVFDILDEVCSIKIIDNGTDMAAYEGYDYGSIILKCSWE